MKSNISIEFGSRSPRAIVLDDHARSRTMTARRLRGRGFDVVECATAEDFRREWQPGMVDLIVADWQLSDTERGDHVLTEVRERDWDVPFVLVSGKLGEDHRRAGVLQSLLRKGSAQFVTRGDKAIAKACDEGERLIERRDLTLLKVILSLRDAARSGNSVRTSTGVVKVSEQLAELVSKPRASHDALRPLADFRSARASVGKSTV